MWALGQGDRRLPGPQLSLRPLPFLAPEEAEGQSLPSEGQLRLRTTGLVDPTLFFQAHRPSACSPSIPSPASSSSHSAWIH